MSRAARASSQYGTWLRTLNLNSGSSLPFHASNKRPVQRVSTTSQVGQTSAGEVKTRDLRAELLAAEQEARNKKRKAEGKPPLAVEDSSTAPAVDEEANKRRKLLQEALELDKDDDDEKDGEDSKMKDEDEDDERCVIMVLS